LNSLKYFCEKRNDIHVVATGSLLGVKLSKGFPVGKVNFLDLAPMSYFEFLNALGHQDLVSYLCELKKNAYMLDFAKHAPKSELSKIMTIWDLLPSQ